MLNNIAEHRLTIGDKTINLLDESCPAHSYLYEWAGLAVTSWLKKGESIYRQFYIADNKGNVAKLVAIEEIVHIGQIVDLTA